MLVNSYRKLHAFCRDVLNQATTTLVPDWAKSVKNSVSTVDGYTSFHLTRIEQRGGNVLICSSFEVCTVNVFINNCTVHLLGIYRPPNTNIQNFVRELHNFYK